MSIKFRNGKIVKGLSIALSTALCVGALCPPTSVMGAAASSTSSNTTRMSVHDPSVYYDSNTNKYYIFGSHMAQASTTDLRNWSGVGTQGYNNKTLYASENVEGVYYIQNVNSGLYLDIEDGSSEDGANIRQWDYNGSDAQKFKIVSAGQGLYYILTGASGYTRCIDVEGGSAEDGTNICQWEYWGGDMQKYRIVQQPDNSYAILTNASGSNSALDVYEWSTEAGGNVNQWAFGGHACQKWNLIEAESNSGSSKSSTGEALEHALASSFLWAGYNDQDCSGGYAVWAPDIIYNKDYVWNDGSKGAYMMYYSTSSTYIRSCIGYAVSKSVTGPFSYVDTVVYSGFTKNDNNITTTSSRGSKTVNTNYNNTNIPTLVKEGKVSSVRSGWFNSNGSYNNSLYPNAIDPTLIYDNSGNLWMTYGSWSGGIYILQLDKKTGQPIYPKTSSGNTDGYFGKRIAGGYGKSGEAPYIIYDEETGYYYLYVTYGWLGVDGGYHVRMYRSKTIDGTYVDAAGNNAVYSSNTNQGSRGIKTFGNYDFSTVGTGYKSGGHNSAFIDTDGARYLVYHTRFNTGNDYHEVRVHQQFMNEDNWPVTAVYEFLGSKISQYGYNMADMTGTYEFVNHGLDAATDKVGMLKTSTIKLNSNGKITGDYSGTWSYTNGTYYCQMVINGVTYKGVFFKQKDETSAHKNVMTFSLIGNNNQCIWGTKTVASTEKDNTSANVPGSSGSGSTNVTNAKLADGWYYIKNVNSQKYLQTADNTGADGTNVEQGTGSGELGQRWYLTNTSNGYVTLKNGTGYMLDIPNGENADGTNVHVWSANGLAPQEFKVVQSSTGKSYGILTSASADTKALDVYEFSTADGGNVCQWTYTDNACQQWIFEPINTASQEPPKEEVKPVVPANTSKSWNFKNTDFRDLGTISKTITVDGLTLIGTNDKKMSIDPDSQTVDGVEYTYRLALGGGGKTSYRAVKVPVYGTDTIKVILKSSGTTERTLIIADENGKQLGTMKAGTTASLETYNYSGNGGYVYLYSAGSGINLYKIQVDSKG